MLRKEAAYCPKLWIILNCIPKGPMLCIMESCVPGLTSLNLVFYFFMEKLYPPVCSTVPKAEGLQ